MTDAIKNTGSAISLTTLRESAGLRWSAYLLLWALPAVFAPGLLRSLFALIWTDQTFSHIPFVPAVSAYFVFIERERIFGGSRPRWGLGAAIAMAGVAALLLARLNPWQWSLADQISLLVAGFVLFWTGAFGFFFGRNAMRAASFPLLFLWFAVPIPSALLSEIIVFLQRTNADAVGVIFRLFHTPVVRQGFDFAFPAFTVRVAEECSGIRSTLALVMTAVLAGHIWLRSFPRTLVLCLATIPIAILKNALRIAILSWLAVYVDPRFLTGSIHHEYGGSIFFVVGLLMMGIVLAALQRIPPSGRGPVGQAPPSS